MMIGISLALAQTPGSSTVVGLIRLAMQSKDFLASIRGQGSFPHDFSSSPIISRVLDGFTVTEITNKLESVVYIEPDV